MIYNILYAVLIFHVIHRCTFAAIGLLATIGLREYWSEATIW